MSLYLLIQDCIVGLFSLQEKCRDIKCGGRLVYKNDNCEDMYVSVTNMAFNMSLLYLYVGAYKDVADMEWMVHRSILDELGYLNAQMSDTMTYVETGYMKESSCTYVNINFSITLRYALEFHSELDNEQTIGLLYNFSKPKSFIVGENSSLERINKDPNCSHCTLNNSITICNKTSTVRMNNDEAFIKRKKDYTCPFIVLNHEEVNNLTKRNIISSTAVPTRRANDFLVCVKDVNFGVIMSQSGTNDLLEIYLTYICFGISTLCTLGFLFVFYITPSMKTLPVKTISNLVGCLFLVQTVYIFSIGANDVALFCYIASVVQHYLWVCTYAWCVICAHHMCTVFHGIHKPQVVTTKRYTIYLCVGYIVPLLFVTLFVIGEKFSCFPFEVGYGGKVCFLNSGKFYGLDVPIIGMLLANLVYFGIIVYCIHHTVITSTQKVSGAKKSSCFLYVKMSTVMGFSWLFGMLAKWTNLYPLWIGFTVINGLQGTFLFLAFTCRRDVIIAIRQTLKGRNKSASSSTRSRFGVNEDGIE